MAAPRIWRPLAIEIAKSGFRCVAIEVTGHGSSPGNRTGWAHFIEDVAALTRSLDQEVHAYVAHSAGGLTTMAARSLKAIQAKLYVCICAPSYPFPPIDVIRKRLNPGQGLIRSLSAVHRKPIRHPLGCLENRLFVCRRRIRSLIVL